MESFAPRKEVYPKYCKDVHSGKKHYQISRGLGLDDNRLKGFLPVWLSPFPLVPLCYWKQEMKMSGLKRSGGRGETCQ